MDSPRREVARLIAWHRDDAAARLETLRELSRATRGFAAHASQQLSTIDAANRALLGFEVAVELAARSRQLDASAHDFRRKLNDVLRTLAHLGENEHARHAHASLERYFGQLANESAYHAHAAQRVAEEARVRGRATGGAGATPAFEQSRLHFLLPPNAMGVRNLATVSGASVMKIDGGGAIHSPDGLQLSANGCSVSLYDGVVTVHGAMIHLLGDRVRLAGNAIELQGDTVKINGGTVDIVGKPIRLN